MGAQNISFASRKYQFPVCMRKILSRMIDITCKDSCLDLI